MTARKKKNVFGWARSRVTYQRDVGAERRELKRQAFADRRERLAVKKLEAQERTAAAKIAAADRKIAAAEAKISTASSKGGRGGSMSEAQFEATRAKLQKEIEKQEKDKSLARALFDEVRVYGKGKNPSWGYGIYQGRGFATRQLAHFRSKVAAETYARSAGLKGYAIKRAFAKDQNPARRNCEVTPASHHSTSAEYQLGYSLGQRDRETASLRRTPGELEATFRAKFDPARASTLMFAEGYEAGYGSTARTAERNPRGQMNRGLSRNSETGEGDGSNEYKQAKRIAELFHGRPVKEELTIEDKLVSPDWYAEIGPLAELRIKAFRGYPFRTAKFRFFTKGDALIHLLTSPDGRQMYLRGGDQEIDLDSMGMGPESEWFRDMMSIGEVTYFAYLDGKKFHGFKMTEYTHKVGSALDWSGTRHIQKTNAKPVMIYDSLSKKISFAGGQGKVETDDLVEGMSPGIVA
jgi:hypothetical protein